jgi:pantothenate kinase type III
MLYIDVISKDLDIFLTGGDAEKFSFLFPNAFIKNHLIFDGMKKIIQQSKKLN